MVDLRTEQLGEVEALLRGRIGLNPQAVHRQHIEDAVAERMAACGIADAARYLALVETHSEEWQELIERLVIVESWFFRDVQPFRFLELLAWRDWKNHDRPLRLLSVPCGAGEEPYSMAMTLLNAGLDERRFRIDAVDICQRALRQARTACYGEASFRERSEPVAGCRTRFFHAAGTRMVVNDTVRNTVRFRYGNLVESTFLAGEDRYDLIFCRNLLIYLDADARALALANLHRLLAPDGVLYVGHVEGGMLRGERFAGCDAAFPFAFRAESALAIDLSATATEPTAPNAVVIPLETECDRNEAAAPSVPLSVEFATACALANQGRLNEAAAQCQALLAQAAPSAAVYCLLGVVRQAQGDLTNAERCFHKALYLDPRHHEALVHLALIAAQRGEESAAQNYRRRAELAAGEG